MTKFKKISFRVLQWILSSMLIVLSLVIIIQIAARYFFQYPLPWTEELALTLMVWITFLGSALIMDDLDHISIDFLVESLSKKTQTIIFIITYTMVLIFNVALIYGGWKIIQSTKDSVLPGMRVPVGWLYGGIFIGSIITSIIIIEHLIYNIKKMTRGEGN